MFVIRADSDVINLDHATYIRNDGEVFVAGEKDRAYSLTDGEREAIIDALIEGAPLLDLRGNKEVLCKCGQRCTHHRRGRYGVGDQC